VEIDRGTHSGESPCSDEKLAHKLIVEYPRDGFADELELS